MPKRRPQRPTRPGKKKAAAKPRSAAKEAKAKAAAKASRSAQAAARTRAARKAAENAVTDEERHFLAAIRADLDDDSPRLIFADWLEEQGKAVRSEFIRVQCDLNRMASDDPRRADMDEREQSLLYHHGKKWLAALPRPVPINYGECHVWGEAGDLYQRGFVSYASVATDRLPQALVLFTDTLVHRLSLNGGSARGLTDQDWLQHLTMLKLSEVSDAAAVLHSPHLGQLRTLGLNACRLMGFDKHAPVSGLTRLDLGGNPLGDMGVVDLVAWPGLANLRALSLLGTGLTAAGLRHVAQAPAAASLEELVLARNPLDTLSALDSNCRLRQLRSLNVSETRLLQQLPADWSCLPHLETLSLNSGRLTSAAIADFAAGAPPTLRELALYNNQIHDEGAVALGRSERLSQLRALDLSCNGIGERGLLALAESPRLQRLETLHVWGNPGLTSRACKALSARFADVVFTHGWAFSSR